MTLATVRKYGFTPADALGTSPSSVQSFRSRNSIYRANARKDEAVRESRDGYEGVLDHGERDGYGLWLDPSVADDPYYIKHWSAVESVVVSVTEERIVLEKAPAETASDASLPEGAPAEAGRAKQPSTGARERGKVKWYDAGKGYGFLARPDGGEDIFVHKSRLEDDLEELSPGQYVAYEVGENERGAVAEGVRAAG